MSQVPVQTHFKEVKELLDLLAIRDAEIQRLKNENKQLACMLQKLSGNLMNLLSAPDLLDTLYTFYKFKDST